MDMERKRRAHRYTHRHAHTAAASSSTFVCTCLRAVQYFRRHFKNCKTPREYLSDFVDKHRLPDPQYTSVQTPDKKFVCTCAIGADAYAPREPSASKKEALQAAALAALMARGA